MANQQEQDKWTEVKEGAKLVGYTRTVGEIVLGVHFYDEMQSLAGWDVSWSRSGTDRVIWGEEVYKTPEQAKAHAERLLANKTQTLMRPRTHHRRTRGAAPYETER